jgi:hypothetical protein
MIHGTTMILLQKMYDEDQLISIVRSFVASIMELDESGIKGFPFFIMQFQEGPPYNEPSPDPKESYIWN